MKKTVKADGSITPLYTKQDGTILPYNPEDVESKLSYLFEKVNSLQKTQIEYQTSNRAYEYLFNQMVKDYCKLYKDYTELLLQFETENK